MPLFDPLDTPVVPFLDNGPFRSHRSSLSRVHTTGSSRTHETRDQPTLRDLASKWEHPTEALVPPQRQSLFQRFSFSKPPSRAAERQRTQAPDQRLSLSSRKQCVHCHHPGDGPRQKSRSSLQAPLKDANPQSSGSRLSSIGATLKSLLSSRKDSSMADQSVVVSSGARSRRSVHSQSRQSQRKARTTSASSISEIEPLAYEGRLRFSDPCECQSCSPETEPGPSDYWRSLDPETLSEGHRRYASHEHSPAIRSPLASYVNVNDCPIVDSDEEMEPVQHHAKRHLSITELFTRLRRHTRASVREPSPTNTRPQSPEPAFHMSLNDLGVLPPAGPDTPPMSRSCSSIPVPHYVPVRPSSLTPWVHSRSRSQSPTSYLSLPPTPSPGQSRSSSLVPLHATPSATSLLTHPSFQISSSSSDSDDDVHRALRYYTNDSPTNETTEPHFSPSPGRVAERAEIHERALPPPCRAQFLAPIPRKEFQRPASHGSQMSMCQDSDADRDSLQLYRQPYQQEFTAESSSLTRQRRNESSAARPAHSARQDSPRDVFRQINYDQRTLDRAEARSLSHALCHGATDLPCASGPETGALADTEMSDVPSKKSLGWLKRKRNSGTEPPRAKKWNGKGKGKDRMNEEDYRAREREEREARAVRMALEHAARGERTRMVRLALDYAG